MLLRLCNNLFAMNNRIAVLRADRKESRQDLAKAIGVNYQTVGFIERGDYSPSLELAFIIARHFAVGVEDVFSDKQFEQLIRKKENI